jgi:hypothetical protein
MAFHGEQHVVTGRCIVVWDGITQPDKNDGGQLVHSLKLACLPTAPEVAELTQIATAALQADAKFRGTLPPGGCWPINNCDPQKIEGKLAGHVEFNAKTYRGAPQVFDANGKSLDPMVYGPMLYPGAIVQAVVHAYSFDNMSKGVAFGLDGIKIIDAKAPRLPVGGGIDASAVFGGAPAFGPPGAAAPPVYQPAPPVYQPAPAPVAANVQPHPGFLTPGAAPPPAPPMPPAPARQMTAAANGVTYEAYIAAGWTEQQLRENGLML